MITQLRGRLVEVHPSYAVVDCNGVGYWVNISLNTYSGLVIDELITLYTQQIIRDDAHLLYGFNTKEERSIFLKLISVNGVGPASAMMMLSTLSPKEIQVAIHTEDAKLLQTVKGIGAKTAQRIIIDLKDKLEEINLEDVNSLPAKNKTRIEALSALEVLGIPRKMAEKTIDQVLSKNADVTVETLVKETLKNL